MDFYESVAELKQRVERLENKLDSLIEILSSNNIEIRNESIAGRLQ